MLYRFVIISDENDDFMREIKIDANDTFLSLHQAIINTCGYTDDELTSFTICENGWEKGQEIMSQDLEGASDQDIYVMEKTRLSEFLEDEKQHLLYTFDMLADRHFFIELSEIKYKEHLDKPVVSRQMGEPPVQKLDFDELMKRNPIIDNSADSDYIDEDMIADDFSDEDIENEGLDIADDRY